MFYSEKFIFDGIENDFKDVVLVTTSNNDILNIVGSSYSETLKKMNTNTDNPYYVRESKDAETMTLEFCLVNPKDNSPMVWEQEDLEDIISWLVQDEFKPFISYDNEEIVYYMKATKVSKKFNHEYKGMLVIEYQLYTNYAYKKFNKKIVSEDEAEVKIVNESSTLDKYYSPIIEIKCNEDSIVSIKNLTDTDTTKELKTVEMKKDDELIIDNLLFTVQDKDGNNKFLSLDERGWIRLLKGNNILKIQGNCQVTIFCEFPKII